MSSAPTAPLDPDDARMNPRVGDVWVALNYPEERRVEYAGGKIVAGRHLDDGLDGDGFCLTRDQFARWTQTAELIERGDANHAE